MQTQTVNDAPSANPVQEFHFRNLFLKNVSFEAPRLDSFPSNIRPNDPEEVEFRAATKARRFLENLYALELRLQVHVTQNGITALSMTLDQMGTSA